MVAWLNRRCTEVQYSKIRWSCGGAELQRQQNNNNNNKNNNNNNNNDNGRKAELKPS